MHLLRRFGRSSARPERVSEPAAESRDADEPEGSVPWSVERATPGVATLLEGVTRDESHAVLDLGAAADSSLQAHSRFARRIRFVDLLQDATARNRWSEALTSLPSQPEQPYDLIFAWDILDRLFPEERPKLVERLAEVSSPDARLHIVVDASESTSPSHPLRFMLVDTDRLRYEPTGPPRPHRHPLLPAEVERLLAPFRVQRAFTVKGGFREYVAVRK